MVTMAEGDGHFLGTIVPDIMRALLEVTTQLPSLLRLTLNSCPIW
jgi:hypothetical protein